MRRGVYIIEKILARDFAAFFTRLSGTFKSKIPSAATPWSEMKIAAATARLPKSIFPAIVENFFSAPLFRRIVAGARVKKR